LFIRLEGVSLGPFNEERQMTQVLIFAGAFVLIGMNSAFAGEEPKTGFECSAIASASATRKLPRTVTAQAATREEARKAVLAACAATAAPKATCKVVRCTPVR
jgi:hypothetical protein